MREHLPRPNLRPYLIRMGKRLPPGKYYQLQMEVTTKETIADPFKRSKRFWRWPKTAEGLRLL